MGMSMSFSQWETLFRHKRLNVPKMRSIGPWIALAAIALLVRMAWRHGIIISVALAFRDLAVSIWNLLCDVGDTFRDVVQSVLSQWSH